MSGSDIEIVIVVDNRAAAGLACEHGFSLWIEADGRRIVFDTGQGAALGPNAEALGLDLATADALVLSHGHYDHTGGLPLAMEKAQDAVVYCHPGAVQPRYAIRNGMAAPIQMPRNAMAVLDRIDSPQLHWVIEPIRLGEHIGLTGPIPRKNDYEDVGGPFFLDPEGRRPDPLEDDLALWIETDDGLVVCVGCCHAGLVNTLEHIRHLTGEEKIRAVIGGFHLVAASRQRLERTVADLSVMAIERIVPCHCTGDGGVEVLTVGLGRRVSQGSAGQKYRF